jgi:hypothetical protein
MFIPFVGAFVRLRESLHSEWQNAIVGLAGPLWGLGASVAAYVAYVTTGMPIFSAIAHASAWLNLFNLLPVWQLDGGRGFSAMSRTHRLIAGGAVTGRVCRDARADAPDRRTGWRGDGLLQSVAEARCAHCCVLRRACLGAGGCQHDGGPDDASSLTAMLTRQAADE